VGLNFVWNLSFRYQWSGHERQQSRGPEYDAEHGGGARGRSTGAEQPAV